MLRPVTLLLIAAIAAMPLSAKKKKEESKEDKYAEYYIEAYFKDGSVVKGYNRTNFTDGAEQLEISAAPKGKADRYDSELVDSVVFPPSDTDQRRVVWETMYAQPWMMKGLFNRKNMSKHPQFLRRIYTGENIKAYTMPYIDKVYTGNGIGGMSTITTLRTKFYFRPLDTDTARCYWAAMGGIMIGFGKGFDMVMKDYPEIIKMRKDKVFSKKEFLNDPPILLPHIDAVIGERKNTTNN